MFRILKLAVFAALGYCAYDLLRARQKKSVNPVVREIAVSPRPAVRIPVGGSFDRGHKVAVWNPSNEPRPIYKPARQTVMLYH